MGMPSFQELAQHSFFASVKKEPVKISCKINSTVRELLKVAVQNTESRLKEEQRNVRHQKKISRMQEILSSEEKRRTKEKNQRLVRVLDIYLFMSQTLTSFWFRRFILSLKIIVSFCRFRKKRKSLIKSNKVKIMLIIIISHLQGRTVQLVLVLLLLLELSHHPYQVFSFTYTILNRFNFFGLG